MALAAALLLQVGTNLVNDWGDFRRGADGPGRLGPLRVSAAGLLAPGVVLAAGLAAFAGAAAVGAGLVVHAGWPIAVVGLAAVAAGIAYTAGPVPLAYQGLGEPLVFAFFGPIAVAGTEYVQAGRVTLVGLAAAVPIGLLATAILMVNNVRDLDTDRCAGKRTLPVRLGRTPARVLYAAVVLAALVAPLPLAASGLASPAVLAAAMSAPLAFRPLRSVLTRTDGPALNAALTATARLHLVFGSLLAAGLLL
jgi:1,4-dihydroxy-2-naphthoate octaprenyltransferase